VPLGELCVSRWKVREDGKVKKEEDTKRGLHKQSLVVVLFMLFKRNEAFSV
jgi:hypothetical protein